MYIRSVCMKKKKRIPAFSAYMISRTMREYLFISQEMPFYFKVCRGRSADISDNPADHFFRFPGIIETGVVHVFHIIPERIYQSGLSDSENNYVSAVVLKKNISLIATDT